MRQAMMFSKRGTSSAEVSASIAAAVGLDQMPYVETFDPVIGGSALNTITANTITLRRVRVAKALPITTIRFDVGATAAGNADAGFYTSSDLSTFTLLTHAGSTAISAANALTDLTLLTPVTLQPGTDYWLAGGFDSATITVLRITAVSSRATGANSVYLSKASAYSSGLPASLSGLSNAGQIAWMRAF